jgi:YHS domain-containing protein
MKTRKMLFMAVLTAMFFTINLSFAQVSHSESDCSKKCEKECTSTAQNTQEKSDCKTECTHKTGDSQGIVSDTAKFCIVTGEKLDGSEGDPVKYTYLGKDYLFCCSGCVKKFKSEPMNYIKEEIKCPVMGNAASKEIFSVVDGVKYYFCCSGCIKKFEDNPKKYLDKQ